MSNHKNRVSAELPDYLLGKHEFTKPTVRERTHARGKNAVLSQVSADAPATFQLPFVQPSTPSARKAAILAAAPSTTPRELRLLSDLHTAHPHAYRQFHYSDFDPNRPAYTDYTSMPLSKAKDLQLDVDAGMKGKLPFYVRYAEAAVNERFRMKLGMFSHSANQRVVGRADANLRLTLQSTVRSSVQEKSASQQSSPRDSRIRSPKALSLSLATPKPPPFDKRALRSVLNSAGRMRKHSYRARSVAPVSTSQEIDSFDQKLCLDLSFHPVTKKSLGDPLSNNPTAS